MTRWNPERWFEFGQWVRNDVQKYRGKPGLTAAAERADLAADLIDAVVATHLSCDLSVCPTRQAIQHVMTAARPTGS